MIPLHTILTLLLIASPSINSAHGDLYTDPAYSSLFPERTVYSTGTIPQDYTMTQVSFEVELGWIDDIPSLNNESDIVVLGNVQETPRYGVGGEAWVDEEWMNYDFDTTLSDRFVVNCTVDQAINMSGYTWVEWTAPIEDGTTYGETRPPEQELGIFFEYGAESGELRPPWDIAGPDPDPTVEGSYVRLDDEHTRTGGYAVKFYQPPPPKSDSQRRVVMKYFDTQQIDFYISWWAYFPDSPWSQQFHSTLGGWQLFFGPPDWKWKWWTASRFFISWNTREVGLSWAWGKASGAEDFSAEADAAEQTWESDFDLKDHLNKWVHFQTYIRLRQDYTGVVRAWINEEGQSPIMFAEKTGIKTDPRGYPEWAQNNCVFNTGIPYPPVHVELYQDTNSPESWYWVDDIVAATQKVPETYKVND